MPVSSCIVIADHLDIHAHLALEEAILDDLAPGATVLLLWQAGPAVVLGKNQNPWLETHPTRLAATAVPLARRVSGGGTVWHDPGNLNVSVFTERTTYDADRVSAFILAAVHAVGLAAAYLGPRHVLMVGERKFSGNAFCYRRNRVLHHGTLLVHADLDRLEAALVPALGRDTVAAKAIASVRARVVNLGDLHPGLTVDALRAALVDAFPQHLAPAGAASSPACPVLSDTAFLAAHPDLAAGLPEALARHRSWEWQVGYTPAFTAHLPLSLTLRIEHGCVAGVVLAEDDAATGDSVPAPAAAPGSLIASLDSAWRGCRFEATALRAALSPAAASQLAAAPALREWLQLADF